MLQDKPTAAPAHFPYHHRNMAQVMRDEARKAFLSLPVKLRRGRTIEDYMKQGGGHDGA